MEKIGEIFNLDEEDRKEVVEIISKIGNLDVETKASVAISAFSVLVIRIYDQMHEANVSKDALMYLANKINMATIACIKDM